jgi:YEATS domain-containing protein 4
VCEKPPYKVTETGWGEFTVNIKVTFVPEASEKALSLQHPIKLHHWGEPIEPPAPQPEPTPAQTPKEAETPKPETEAEASLAPTETSATDAATPADPTTGVATPAEPVIINPYNTSVGSYPVHSWQYDEMVFSDPPANFLSLLEQNTPTPLPSRPRRPRDQREEHELRTGKKRAKPSGARTGNTSRAGTEAPEGMTTRAGTPASVATPTPGQPPVIGVSGELGSADVPLEFSVDMEKGELNRLTETRVKIVREMDRWREKLIAQEKELAKLKEEMKNSTGVL